ncbi:hypothetical protein bthur0005_60870 [Bacillus thuringiensis serovar pakistani str. T13001]|nr:hypothetical protein bthur0005_60870 [Bacillus thuringiensis serovar pakistani str. T13001]
MEAMIMKKKLLGMMACGTLALGMMTIGSGSVSAEPLKTTNTSQFGTQTKTQAAPKFLGDIVDGVTNIAGAVLSTGSVITDAVGKVAGDQWTGMAAKQAWGVLDGFTMVGSAANKLGFLGATAKQSDTSSKNIRAAEIAFDNK